LFDHGTLTDWLSWLVLFVAFCIMAALDWLSGLGNRSIPNSVNIYKCSAISNNTL